MRVKGIKIMLLVYIIIITLLPFTTVKASEASDIVIYFSSPTCSSCIELDSFFSTFISKNVKIIKYDISIKENKGILNSYCNEYKVKKEEYGLVPIVFIGNTYLSGPNDIKKNLEKKINEQRLVKTKIIITPDYEYDVIKFDSMNIYSVIIAGLINGINPCTLSIFIFFISIILNGKRPLIIGFSYILGKFISFLLLGIVFFTLLENINVSYINSITKLLICLICIIMIAFNILDFLNSQKMNYGKLKLKLPNKLITFNHQLIGRINNYDSLLATTLFCFILGFVINFGEFLCTGQIYLTTIVTMITNNVYEHKAITYLVIYGVAYILPLMLITLLILKAKSVYSTSDKLIKFIPIIKILNAIFFLGIILLFIL